MSNGLNTTSTVIKIASGVVVIVVFTIAPLIGMYVKVSTLEAQVADLKVEKNTLKEMDVKLARIDERLKSIEARLP